MFEAKPHRLLVPYDGAFDARKAPTAAPRKEDWEERLEKEVKGLADAQYRLFADGRFAMLIVVQALDAAGKDGLIRHVFSGVNPSGLHVAAFKQPTSREAAHDFLWRTTACLPERGSIAVFNRSYYEEVLVTRVHPELLAAQRLSTMPNEKLWENRLRAITDHELHLAEQGTVILKFWLNVSKREQRERLLERIDEPDKNWKFSSRDVDERERWDDYIVAYERALNATSRPWAPWYVVPADDKDYLRWQVAKLVNEAFDALELEVPRSNAKRQAELERAKKRLLAERD